MRHSERPGQAYQLARFKRGSSNLRISKHFLVHFPREEATSPAGV